MNLTKEHQLFEVEIDNPNKVSTSFLGGRQNEFKLIIAKDIHEASIKIMQHIEYINNTSKMCVITKDGDLNLKSEEECKIKIIGVKIVNRELIF